MFRTFQDLEAYMQGMPKKHVIVVCPHDTHTFQALLMALEKKMVNYTLVGNEEKMSKALSEAGWPSLKELAGPSADAVWNAPVETFYSGATLESTEKTAYTVKGAAVSNPAHPSCKGIYLAETDEGSVNKAVSLIDAGQGDFIMKGTVDTAVLLRVIVRTETELFGASHISHVSLVEIPTYKKLFGITDGGMMPHPTLEEKEIILRNAVDLFRNMDYETPVVACVAATERTSARMPETTDAAALTENCKAGKYGSCIVGGPMAFDLIFDPECARIKGFESPVTGNFDVILTPEITTGNLLTKALVHCVPGGKFAGTIVGSRMPIALCSRGSTAEEKYLSLLFAQAAVRK